MDVKKERLRGIVTQMQSEERGGVGTKPERRRQREEK